jgi:Mg-chelatase subunit ChlD
MSARDGVLVALAALALAGCTGGDVVPRDLRDGTGGTGGAGGTGGTRADAMVMTKATMRPDAGVADASARPDAGLPTPNIAAIFKTGCASASMQSELLPSNLLFVIDRSASMACNPPPTTASTVCEQYPVRADPQLPTKWEITRDALAAAISALPHDTVAGLAYFSNDDACGVHSTPSVPLAPLDQAQSSTIQASLAAVEPSGATPLVGATILAYRHLHELALAGAIHGKQFVVLLTDGQQSEACSDDTQCSGQQECTDLLVNTEVPKAAAPGVGIKTFVIGAPGSEPAKRVLSQIAKNGGTAPDGCDVTAGNCHFDMTTQAKFDQALADALTKIAGRALSCVLPMPMPGKNGVQVDPRLVNVVYSPADGSQPSLILKDDRSPCDNGADGWQYTDNATKITLCGKACDEVRSNRGARVDVVLGCPFQAVQ